MSLGSDARIVGQVSVQEKDRRPQLWLWLPAPPAPSSERSSVSLEEMRSLQCGSGREPSWTMSPQLA